MATTLKVLLADDDPEDKDLFIQSLELLKLPHKIIWVKDNKELFEVLEREPDLDLVVLDINLPKIDGKECLRQIKAHEKYKCLPVIILTVSKRAEDIDEIYDCGAHYYAIKPYSLINYAETLKRIFNIDWKIKQPIPAKADFVINLAFA